MFTNFISRILANERGPVVNRQASTTSDVIENSGTPHISGSEKYEKDIESLRVKYGDSFQTGLCIEISLKEILELCPRDRHRKDAYHGLVSFLKNKRGITLNIKSQKTKKL